MPEVAAGLSGDFTGVIQLDEGNEPELYLTSFAQGPAAEVPAPVYMVGERLAAGLTATNSGITGGSGCTSRPAVAESGRVISSDAVATDAIDGGSGLSEGTMGTGAPVASVGAIRWDGCLGSRWTH